MPYPNFHAARIIEPNKFQNIVVLETLPNGVMLYGGKLKGETSSTVQAYRFPKEKFTVTAAKKWLEEHDLKSIMFEEASEKIDEIDTFYENRIDEIMFERIDQMEWPCENALEGGMVEKFKLTPEGYLKGRAIVTNIGVFPYRKMDGSITYELRPPEEIFKPDSINSLKMLPIINEHQAEKIDGDNIRQFQIGFSGEDVKNDSYHISTPIIITDGNAIGEAQGGKRALSCGYAARIENKSGNWMGVHYDAIQRDVKYNHIAMTKKGRAGDAAVMKFDSVNIGIMESKKIYNDEGGNSMNFKIIKIDGVDYQAEPQVIQSLTLLKEENEKLKNDLFEKEESFKKDKTVLEAERDKFKEDSEQIKNETEDLKKSIPQLIEDSIKQRIQVLDAAKKANIEIKEDSTELEIKKQIILSLYPTAKEKLDNADENYVNIRFDGAVERLEEIQKEVSTEIFKKDSIENEGSNKLDSRDAYKKQVAYESNLWKSNKIKEEE